MSAEPELFEMKAQLKMLDLKVKVLIELLQKEGVVTEDEINSLLDERLEDEG